MSTNHNAADPPVATDIIEEANKRNSTISGGSSDGEGAERTAREKLKKTSIAGLAQFSNAGGDSSEDQAVNDTIITEIQSNQPGEQTNRGRPSKKRSFEDLQNDDSNTTAENGNIGPPLPKSGHHKRMRSRDVSNADEVQKYGKIDEKATPVQEESDVDARESPGGPGVLVEAPTRNEQNQQPKQQSSDKEDVQNTSAMDASTVAATTALNQKSVGTSSSVPQTTDEHHKPVSSIATGFGNISATSPFGSVKPSTEKSGEPIATSNSAFASSGLSAFASSEKSPFGAAGSSAQTTGGFGGGNASGGFGSLTSGSSIASPFTTKGSSGFGIAGGFGSTGGFGSGFGSRPFGGGLSSFASPSGSMSTFGKPKPFGGETREVDDEEGSDNGEEGAEAEQQSETTKQDNRFVEQGVETGEEDEETIFTARARLYHFFEKEWKERGAGIVKVNVRYVQKSLGTSTKRNGTEVEGETHEEGDDLEVGTADNFTATERKGRLIMRTDGVHRLILNTPVFKDMNVGTTDGKEPNGRTMFLTGLENGRPVGFQIKIGKEENLKDLYFKIQDLKSELP